MELDQIIKLVKLLWPIAAWVAWVNHTVKQNQKAIDLLYYEKRGNKGMRCRSITGRIRRAVYGMRKKKHGNL